MLGTACNHSRLMCCQPCKHGGIDVLPHPHSTVLLDEALRDLALARRQCQWYVQAQRASSQDIYGSATAPVTSLKERHLHGGDDAGRPAVVERDDEARQRALPLRAQRLHLPKVQQRQRAVLLHRQHPCLIRQCRAHPAPGQCPAVRACHALGQEDNTSA